MRIRCLILGLSMCVLLALVGTAARAQEDGLSPEEQARVAYVASAFEALNALDSYTIDGKQTMLMAMEDVIIEMRTALRWQIVPYPDGNIEAAAGTAEMTMTISTDAPDSDFDEMEMLMSAETIFLDMKQYFRISIESDMQEVEDAFPDMWFVMDLGAYIAEMEDTSGGALGLDFETLSRMTGNEYASKYMIPVTTESVRSIAEEESVTIEGVDYRVFRTEIDPRGTIPDEFAGFVDVAEQIAESSIAFDAEPDPEVALWANLSEIMDNLVIRQEVWVNTATGLPHRVVLDQDYGALIALMSEMDPEIELSGGEMRLTSDVELTDFDAPFTVMPPKNAFEIPVEALLE